MSEAHSLRHLKQQTEVENPTTLRLFAVSHCNRDICHSGNIQERHSNHCNAAPQGSGLPLLHRAATAAEMDHMKQLR